MTEAFHFRTSLHLPRQMRFGPVQTSIQLQVVELLELSPDKLAEIVHSLTATVPI